MTQKAEKFSQHQSVRKNDQEWIEKKLVEGKFRQVRDISQSSTPIKDPTPLSPKRLESPIVLEDQDLGRGKRTKIQKTPCQNAGCTNEDCMETSEYHSHVQHPTSPVRRALFFDFDSEPAIPDDGDPNYEVVDEDESIPEPKTPRPTFQRVLDLQARFNTPDCQVALWWNCVSLDQGITDSQRLTCGSTVANMRINQIEKTISSHIQENIGFPDMGFDGKKSQTAVGRN